MWWPCDWREFGALWEVRKPVCVELSGGVGCTQALSHFAAFCRSYLSPEKNVEQGMIQCLAQTS